MEISFEYNVLEKLNEVLDPELGLGIRDLGLIYRVVANENVKSITVDMTLTTPNCPMSEMLPEMARERLKGSFPDWNTYLNVVWTPAWTPDRINESGRQLLGMKS
ncbi:MAG: metal-sulfur cluster assembly factor [Cytophagaceae bacterium]